jgi:RNA polymerase sigma-70 factor (sigma-E family)
VAVDFEELVAARGQALLRFAVMLCGDRDRAEDLVQSVLAKAYRRWSRVAAADRPEAYLKAMVVNEHLGWWRRRSNQELPAAEPCGAEPVSGDGTAARASRDAAWTLLATLSRRQRAVLVLRYYEDLSDDQIAVVLGCGASTVRGTAARALGALRVVVPTMDRELLP